MISRRCGARPKQIEGIAVLGLDRAGIGRSGERRIIQRLTDQ
jgi:hypothetical protein